MHSYSVSLHLKTALKQGVVIFISLFVFTQCTEKQEFTTQSSSPIYSPSYAKLFSLSRAANGDTLLSIYQQQDTLRFMLSYRNSPQGNTFIKLPISKGIFFSSTHLAYLQKLNALETVAGVSRLDFIVNDTLLKNLNEKKVVQVGEYGSSNNELIAALSPDVLITSGFGQNLYNHSSPTLPILEWKEETPLGRAEWIIIFGILTGNFELAKQEFDFLEKAYKEAKATISPVGESPTVMVGFPYQGQWYSPGGNSFMCKFIEDAGGTYIWNHLKGTGSLTLNFEEVYDKGLNTEYWIIAGKIDSLSTVLATDARFKNFLAYQQKKVFNNNKRTNKNGWNEYYENSVINPHYVLQDLIQMIHPEQVNNRSLYYYKQLAE